MELLRPSSLDEVDGGLPIHGGTEVVPLLRSGFRLDGFPVLICWDRPFADFARFIPMSPGLL